MLLLQLNVSQAAFAAIVEAPCGKALSKYQLTINKYQLNVYKLCVSCLKACCNLQLLLRLICPMLALAALPCCDMPAAAAVLLIVAFSSALLQ